MSPNLTFHPADESAVDDHRIAVRSLIKDVDELIRSLHDKLDQAMKHRSHLLCQLAGRDRALHLAGSSSQPSGDAA